jgi:hypothetical protein
LSDKIDELKIILESARVSNDDKLGWIIHFRKEVPQVFAWICSHVGIVTKCKSITIARKPSSDNYDVILIFDCEEDVHKCFERIIRSAATEIGCGDIAKSIEVSSSIDSLDRAKSSSTPASRLDQLKQSVDGEDDGELPGVAAEILDSIFDKANDPNFKCE